VLELAYARAVARFLVLNLLDLFLSAGMRIRALADAGPAVAIRWRPFLLGPIFKAHGWGQSPFQYLRGQRAAICGAIVERICADSICHS